MKPKSPSPHELVRRFIYEYGLIHPVKSAVSYRSGIDKLYESCSGELNIDSFIAYPMWLAKQRKYKRGTRLFYTASVSVFFDWLIMNEKLSPTPVEIMRFKNAKRFASRSRESKLPKNPPQDTLDALRDAVKNVNYFSDKSPARYRDVALVEFLYSTGCRIGEAAGLEVRDVDLTRNTAKVMGKGSKERYVFFSTLAKDSLVSYWNMRGFQGLDDPAFSQHRNLRENPPIHLTTQRMWQIIRKVMKLAGIPKRDFTPHYFRHAFATRMLSKTDNLALVQDLLGHDDPKSTRVYAKVSRTDLADAHRKVYG